MFPQYSMFLCGIHFIQTDLNEAYRHRAVEKMKIPSVNVFDRTMPMPVTPERRYDKKRMATAQNYFRKWAAFLHHSPGVFPMVIRNDLEDYFKTNDTVGHVVKFAFSMARNHIFCEAFSKLLRSRVTGEDEKNSSRPFERYFDELERWSFCEEDVAFLNILHQALFPYADEKVHKSSSVQIAGTNMTVPYETVDMCPELSS